MGVGKIICIDGSSNSGKTTLCKKIAEHKDFVYIKECTEGRM